ncbi:MFS transporter [Burkholderia cepacia]|uniref:MFS transporter n=1 Tax=Burkholderia cepacia TaxID=292 RepID=UPI0009BFC1D5|nr:MFS transporter [Burkholderia cepacia]
MTPLEATTSVTPNVGTGEGGGTPISRRLDALPVGSFHYKMMTIIGAGLFLDGFELAMASGILGQLVKTGWSTLKFNGYFVTATFIGFMIGCWAAGVIGDRLGRRVSYQLNLAIFGGASLLAVVAPNIEVLIALRFVMGIGLGAELVLGFATLAEFVPPSKRGRLVATLSFIAQCGVFLSSAVALWVIPNLGWRFMFLIAGGLAAIVWFLRKFMPESPRWLENKGRSGEADAIVRDIEVSVGVRAPLVANEPAREPQNVHVKQPGTSALFRKEFVRRTIIGIATLCVIQICLYGMVSWLPTFFVQQGFDIVKSLKWSMVMTLGGPAGGLIGLLLADRLGRKPILAGAAFVAIGLSYFYVQQHSETILMTLGFLLLTSFYVIVVVGQAVYVSELFPTSIRMRGTGLCSTVARVIAASIQFIIPPLFAWGGINAIVTAVGVSLLIFALIVVFAGVETKSKSLESITV